MWTRRKHHHALRILLVTNFLVLVGGAMLGPIYALFVTEIGGDLLDASYAGAVFAAAGGLTVLISGKLADKAKEPKCIMAFGYIILALGNFSFLLVDSVATLLIAQVIVGLGEALYAPAFDMLYSKHLSKEHGASEWSSWEAMNYFNLALGALAGGAIVTYFGFDGLFVVMGTLTLASGFFVLRKTDKQL